MGEENPVEKIGKELERPLRTGRSSAERTARQQKRVIAEQKQKQRLELAEAENEEAIVRSRALSPRKGRRSLIRGLVNNLG